VETIRLQAKARPLEGTIEHYWFENEHVGLARTLFHRICIPFEPFDSGLDYVAQPERSSSSSGSTWVYAIPPTSTVSRLRWA
jgi:hypothetical protein